LTLEDCSTEISQADPIESWHGKDLVLPRSS